MSSRQCDASSSPRLIGPAVGRVVGASRGDRVLLSDRVHRERAALRVVDLALTCNRGGDDRVRGRCGGIEHIQVGDAVAVRRRADFELVITAADRNPEGAIAELVRGARIGGPIGAEEALLATREVEERFFSTNGAAYTGAAN